MQLFLNILMSLNFILISGSTEYDSSGTTHQRADIYRQESVRQSFMDNSRRDYILSRVNRVRTRGCKCGSEWMEPVNSVQWNVVLEQTAREHADQMESYDFFSHHSLDGKNIGQRLDEAGYKWRYAGENIAEGQGSFDEVLNDWIESTTHCKMLMNPKMEEMGVARVGRYWVQHFGTKMPSKTVRKKTYYREG